jgi:uncharacterized protein (DUF58 family)
MKASPPLPKGVVVTLPELIKLKYFTSGFSLLPKQPVKSLLAGKYGSKLRGRGLNFEEIRQYRPGDDIRNMDWKVTARTGKPHTRVYTEERDRPVIAIVDQRLSMFFGSQVNMKSVTAAQIAAISLWKAMQDHDRVGAYVFNDTEVKTIRPHRSQKNMTTILSHLVGFNQQLATDAPRSGTAEMLNKVLKMVLRQKSHDYLYIVISDFWGVTSDSYRFVKQIAKNNDLLLFLTHDPIAKKMSDSGIVKITDGSGKMVEVDSSYERIQQQFPKVLEGRMNELIKELSLFGVPTLPFNTVDNVAEQLRNLLGK